MPQPALKHEERVPADPMPAAPDAPPENREAGAAQLTDNLDAVDDVATRPPPPPDGRLLGEARLTFKMHQEPIAMVHDYSGTTGGRHIWGSWNNSVTVDTTASTTTCNVYRVWVNGNDCTGGTGATDVGWETTDGGVYRATRGTANTWRIWTSGTNTGDTLTIDNAWGNWNDGWQPTPAQVIGFPAVHTRRRTETPEERQAREEREVRQRAEYAERERVRQAERAKREAEKKVINGRAEQLLLSLMNEQQRRDWIASGQFFLIKGDRRYRIKRGVHGNVDLVDEKNQVLENFCAYPGGNIPVADVLAGQLLALQCDEEEFIKKANATMHKAGHTPLKQQIREGKLHLAA